MKDQESVDKALREMERRFRSEGFCVVRFTMKRVKGCRGCGDQTNGPWIVTLIGSKEESKREAIVSVVTFCRKCLGNEDIRDDVADKMVNEYLGSQMR